MQTATSDALAQARRQAEASQFKDALDTIRSAKEGDPRNVYILAIERQLVKLVEFSDPSGTTTEEAGDTLDLFQILIDQALGGTSDNSNVGNTVSTGRQHTALAGAQKSERENAIAALKNQYLARADGCMMTGDYQGALFEIRRIYVLDPENETAREYEERIRSLLPQEAHEPVKEVPVDEVDPATFPQDTLTFEDTVPATEEPPYNEVKPLPPQQPSLTYSLKREHKRPRSLKRVVVPLIIMILVAASAAYILMKRSADDKMLARFTEDQPPATAESVSSPAKPVTGESPSQSVDTRTANNQTKLRTSVETPIPKVIPSAPSEEKPIKAASKTGGEGAQSTSPTTVPSRSETKPVAAETSKKQEDTLKRADPKTIAMGTPQPLAPIVPPSQPANVSPQPEVREAPTRFVPVQKEPKLLRLEKVQFSNELLRMGIVGEVIVRVKIGPNGKPLEAKVLKSSNQLLDDAVVQSVMNSDYSPGEMSTGPVATWVTIPFRFKQ